MSTVGDSEQSMIHDTASPATHRFHDQKNTLETPLPRTQRINISNENNRATSEISRHTPRTHGHISKTGDKIKTKRKKNQLKNQQRKKYVTGIN